MSLNPKQQRFVQEYLIDLNATQAAIRAGYSAKTAEQQGPRLLGNAGVAEAIARAQGRIAQKLEITAEAVVQELARIAFANAGDYFDWSPGSVVLVPSNELTREQKAAVAEVSETQTSVGRTIKMKLHSKTDALDKLARHLGIYNDSLNVNVSHEDWLKQQAGNKA